MSDRIILALIYLVGLAFSSFMLGYLVGSGQIL